MSKKAFIIGANTQGLKYVMHDVTLMQDCLSFYGYTLFQCDRLTKWEILSQFESWITGCDKIDTAILYFSGHGSIESGRLHLILDDQATSLDIGHLTMEFKKCRARNKLIILDCCHAGATHREWTPSPSDAYRLLTASNRLEKSKELEELQAGFLSYYVHYALTKAAYEIVDEQGYIRINALFDWLVEKSKAHNARPHASQVPLPNLLGNQRDNFEIAVIGGHDNVQVSSPLSGMTPQAEIPAFSPVSPQVFHNLPHTDYARFIGRTDELAKIKNILRPYPVSQHSVVTIDGIGGIGKSALALEIAHYYWQNYETLPVQERFDAIIWTSAKPTFLDAQGIKPRDNVRLKNLDGIYHAIGVALQREDIQRTDPEKRHEVVKHALTQQRTLLIIDNLETVDDEKVFLFLRELPAPTKAIVTTRHRVDVAYPIRLQKMEKEEARQLIVLECEKKGVQRETLDWQHIYLCTGGVPLAIVWSIGQIGLGALPERVLETLKEPNDVVQFCFGTTLEHIENTPAHKLLMVFALSGDSINRECLGVVTGLSERERDSGILELERLSLVNKQADRFSLLPLTKRFVVHEFLRYPEKEALGKKWREYFATYCQEYSGGYWKWINYDWLIAEGSNIHSIVDQALALNQEEVAVLFAHPLLLYLDITGYEAEVKEYGEKFYALAQMVGDKPLQAWLNVYVFGWYSAQEDEELARTYITKGVALYEELEDIKGRCFATIRLGRLERMKGQYDAAEKIYHSVLELAQAYTYANGVVDAYFGLGSVAIDQTDWKRAKTYFEKVIEYCEQEVDLKGKVDMSFWQTACSKLGWVEYCLGNYRRGKELLEDSLFSLKYVGGKRNIVNVHLRLARVEEALANHESALYHARQAHFWAERLGIQQKHDEAVNLLHDIAGEQDDTT